jgi:hypothetical protein
MNADNARIYGSENDCIYLAPLGTTVPTDIDSPLDAAFEDVGWLHSDGITESQTGSVEKIRGHQGNGVVRTRINEPGTTISFTALETKDQTNSLRYVESDVTTAAGVRKATRGAGQKIATRVAVIDVFDADNDEVKERFVIPRFEVSPNGDRAMVNSDIAGFPFVGEIIGEYTHYSTELDDES